ASPSRSSLLQPRLVLQRTCGTSFAPPAPQFKTLSRQFCICFRPDTLYLKSGMFAIALLLLTALGASAQAPATGYVGSEVCKTCHSDIWFNFYKNPHFKSIAAGNLPPERTGCEGCHGPAKAHIEAGGGKTTIPRAFSLMPRM